MKIRIDGYESPHVLRALATLLTTLADEPMRAGCPVPCDKPVNDETYVEFAPVIPPPPPLVVEAPEPDYSAAAGYIPVPPVTLDKTGTPWDARIHSSSRALVANGTWRLKKGVDKALVESVTRELREPERAAMFSAQSSVEPVVAVHIPQPPLATGAAVNAAGIPPLGVVPPPPALPVAAQPVAMPFNEISRYFAINSMAGKLTHADMEAMAKHSGVTYTQDLMTAAHASKRPAALAYLQQLVESRAPVSA